ncbi:MAG: pyridoxamine 5'-phosphate oxidase [Anaerolineales bacterium]
MKTFSELRREYETYGLNESEVSPDPLAQFQRWFDEAVAAGIEEPNAMTLATATRDGKPSARMVLLKSVDARGFTFFTNHDSRKARELAENPHAALVFHWQPLHRQVRVTGAVEKVSAEESDAYFAARPREAQLGAWASRQSSGLPNRAALEAEFERLQREYADRQPPRPPHWGGYRLSPVEIEFWQGRPHRLHDRLHYRHEGERWVIERLAP